MPTELKIHRGNRSKENLKAKQASEPKPPKASLDPPEILEGAALEMWTRRAQQLAAMGLFTQADRETLERYCLTYELFYAAYRSVKSDGLAAATEGGGMKGNPVVAAMRGYHADLLRIEQEFGLTPSSRSTLTVEHGKEVDPLDAFLSASR